MCEDAVQTALLRALQSWPMRGAPDDKSAWLFRVAYNGVVDGIRPQRRAGERVALEHGLAPSYRETRWQEIARLYELLEQAAPSPLSALDRAIAIALAEWQGAAAGLAILEALQPPAWLRDYYLWDAALGALYRRDRPPTRAAHRLRRALEHAPTHAERTLLRKRLAACLPD